MRKNPSSILSLAALPLCQQLESRVHLTATTWTINGDANGHPIDDTIIIEVNPTNSKQFRAVVNDKVVETRAIKTVKDILINGGGGDDDIEIDLGPDFDNIDSTILGGAGDDTLDGGSGDDFLRGGGGHDELSGNLGDDNLWGGNGDDELLGDEGNDNIWGQGNSDTIVGGLGDDNLWGGAGSDQISGGYDNDVIRGGDGKDTLRGGDGADSLNGGGGRDIVFRQEIDYWKFDRFDKGKWDIRVNQLESVDHDAIKQKLIDLAMARWKDSFDQPVWNWWYLRGGVDNVYVNATGSAGAVPASLQSQGAGATQGDPTDHSNTNTQEAGVDEADIVKTDGNYLYLVQDHNLIILDAWPADQTHIVSTTKIIDNGWIQGIYLDGDKLTVISSTWLSGQYDLPPGGVFAAGGADAPLLRPLPIWGGWYSKPQVKVTTLDVSDRANPKKLDETTYDGSLSDSRKVDSRVYLVLDNNIEAPPPQILQKDGNSVYESADTYRARLEAMTLEDLLPGYTVSKTVGAQQVVHGGYLGEDNLYLADKIENNQSMFSVVLIDLASSDPGPKSSTSVVGFAGTTYASTENLYVTAQSWDSPFDNWNGDYQTDIYKFSLGDNSVPLQATGEVPGWTLNQFTMGENGNDFHIATTTSSGGQSNNVFTLQQHGDHLDITGGLTGLAFTESIRSARFIGDRGYLVTFHQIDPLFTLDLSDPKNPQVAGILKIPGFSSYLHPIDDKYLIGFGRDADVTGRVAGLQASLFDVSDIHNPKLVGTYKFQSDDTTHPGWFWTSSGAEWDHHAFSYFPDQKILAVPVLDYGWWTGHAKLALLKLDETTGFTPLAEIHQDSQVLRSLRIDKFIYSIAQNDIKVISLDDPNTVINTTDLPVESPPQPTPL